MRTLRTLAFLTAGFAYAVIVIGFIVRITGSGMGCGPDWPLCNGRLIPAFTGADVMIEWLHRVAVVGLTLLTVATVGVAVTRRREPGGSGSGGTLRPALLALALLVVQSVLGRRAVRLELDPATVVLHLGMALALLATMLVVGLRAGGPLARAAHTRGVSRGAMAAVVLAGVVIMLGGLTANLGAGWACRGFPLCSGELWPASSGGGLAHVHWTHRLAAYALFFHLIGLALTVGRRRAPPVVRAAGWGALGLATLQVVLGAIMVLTSLPPVWRGLHAAVGTALWAALIYLVWVSWPRTAHLAATAPRSADQPSAFREA